MTESLLALRTTGALLRPRLKQGKAPDEHPAFEPLKALVERRLAGDIRYQVDEQDLLALRNQGLVQQAPALAENLNTDSMLLSDSTGGLWFSRTWMKAKSLLEALDERARSKSPAPKAPALTDLPKDITLGLEQSQMRALQLAISSRISVIHGGAGTGKTFLAARIARALANSGKTVAIATPTGRAANRLHNALLAAGTYEHQAPGTVWKPQTIHRLLGIRPDASTQYHSDNQVPVDALILDESSMVDIGLAQAILSALPKSAPLIMIGDDGQLPPVGLGAPFALLCNDKTYQSCRVRLQKAQRYSDDSGLLGLAELIRTGDADTVLAELGKASNGWLWTEIDTDPSGASDRIDALLPTLTDWWAKHPPSASDQQQQLEGYRVLCPRRTGLWGAEQLNIRMHRYLLATGVLQPFPQANSNLRVALAPGTPVTVTRNNYFLNLFNGDVGLLTAADDPQSRNILASFPGDSATSKKGQTKDETGTDDTGRQRSMFPLHELGEWDLSWLMTIHRAQGSEYRRISVIMAGADKASGEHTNLSGRSLLYTALTRAREHVHLFASEQEIRRLLPEQEETTSPLQHLH